MVESQKLFDSFEIFGLSLIGLLFIAWFLGSVLLIYEGVKDIYTVKEFKNVYKPCVDKMGNEFKDEMCFAEYVTCSEKGIAGNYKCSELISKLKEDKK